jgi:hypothetical protein
MKNLKYFKLFENNINNTDLLDIKDIFQEVADEWNILYVDEDELWNSGSMVWTIRSGKFLLIDIFLPPPNHMIYKGDNWYKFREDINNVIMTLKSIGWEKTYDDSDGVRYQIVID